MPFNSSPIMLRNLKKLNKDTFFAPFLGLFFFFFLSSLLLQHVLEMNLKMNGSPKFFNQAETLAAPASIHHLHLPAFSSEAAALI